jgi:hypothetical protein
VWLGSVAFYYTSDHILTHVYVCVGIRVNALENEEESVKSDNRERERERGLTKGRYYIIIINKFSVCC